MQWKQYRVKGLMEYISTDWSHMCSGIILKWDVHWGHFVHCLLVSLWRLHWWATCKFQSTEQVLSGKSCCRQPLVSLSNDIIILNQSHTCITTGSHTQPLYTPAAHRQGIQNTAKHCFLSDNTGNDFIPQVKKWIFFTSCITACSLYHSLFVWTVQDVKCLRYVPYLAALACAGVKTCVPTPVEEQLNITIGRCHFLFLVNHTCFR